jgi:hypothetical protein
MSYFRRFIPNFAVICLPLTKKLRKNVLFEWNDEDEKSFLKLKELLCTEPILKLPDFSKPFIVNTDACKSGLAAVLLQQYNDGEHPVCYASRITNIQESYYCVSELECLVVLFAFKFLYATC